MVRRIAIGRIAWGSAILTFLLIIAGNAFRGATPAARVPAALQAFANGWWIRLSPLYALTFAVVGALIISRRPSNRVGWGAAAIGLLTALYQFGLGYIYFGQYGPGGGRECKCFSAGRWRPAPACPSIPAFRLPCRS